MARPWPVPALQPQRRSADQLTLVVATRVAETWSWAPTLDDPARVDELHAMRLSAKRLRYLLEDLRPLLGKGAGKALKRLRRLQDALGAVHDADVAIATLRAELDVQAERRARLAKRLAEARPVADERLHDAALTLADSFGELPSAGLARLLADAVRERQALHAALCKRFARLDADGLRQRLVDLAA